MKITFLEKPPAKTPTEPERKHTPAAVSVSLPFDRPARNGDFTGRREVLDLAQASGARETGGKGKDRHLP
jgi:hypothetical protein